MLGGRICGFGRFESSHACTALSPPRSPRILLLGGELLRWTRDFVARRALRHQLRWAYGASAGIAAGRHEGLLRLGLIRAGERYSTNSGLRNAAGSIPAARLKSMSSATAKFRSSRPGRY